MNNTPRDKAVFPADDRTWPRPPAGMEGTVAIIVRTRERPLLLKRACETVLAQTHRNWSLLVINDGGSIPDVEACLAPYRPLFGDRLAVRHNEVCQGGAKAANLGLAGVQSEFVALLDDDDTWLPDFLRETTACLMTRGSESLGGVVTQATLITERIENGAVLFEGEEPLNAGMRAVFLDAILARNHIPTCSLVFRRALLDCVGGHDEKLRALSDWDFLIRLAREAEIGVVAKPLANRHRRTNLQGTTYANGSESVTGSREEALARNEAVRRSLADSSRPPGAFLGLNARLLEATNALADLQRDVAALRRCGAPRVDLGPIEECLRRVDRLGGEMEALTRRVDACRDLLDSRLTRIDETHLWLGVLTWPLRVVWRPVRRLALRLAGR